MKVYVEGSSIGKVSWDRIVQSPGYYTESTTPDNKFIVIAPGEVFLLLSDGTLRKANEIYWNKKLFTYHACSLKIVLE